MKIPVRKSLFWDLDLSKMDSEANRRIIIERVFNLGNLDELKFIFRYYGTDIIKNEIVKVGSLDNKTLKFASDILNIPKEKFKYYKRGQSVMI